MTGQATIYVDLKREEPLEFESWAEANDLEPGEDAQNSYRAYRLAFQPFRLLVKSGDNHKPLFRSTERYANEVDARHAAVLAFGANSNVYLRRPEQANEALRMAQ